MKQKDSESARRPLNLFALCVLGRGSPAAAQTRQLNEETRDRLVSAPTCPP